LIVGIFISSVRFEDSKKVAFWASAMAPIYVAMLLIIFELLIPIAQAHTLPMLSKPLNVIQNTGNHIPIPKISITFLILMGMALLYGLAFGAVTLLGCHLGLTFQQIAKKKLMSVSRPVQSNLKLGYSNTEVEIRAALIAAWATMMGALISSLAVFISAYIN
jgi:hypothetical protein